MSPVGKNYREKHFDIGDRFSSVPGKKKDILYLNSIILLFVRSDRSSLRYSVPKVTLKHFLNHLGKHPLSKADEFSKKFQTAVDPPPPKAIQP